MNVSKDYTYEIITNEDDARVCAQLLAEEFANHNPIAMFDHLTSDHLFHEDTWPLITEILDQQLSFLVRHRSSGEIVATIFAADLYLMHEKHPYDPTSPPSSLSFLDLLDELDDAFIRHDFGQELKANLVLQILMGATRATHSAQGIATQLRTAMIRHARDVRGFQYGLVQTSNPATHHIYLNKMAGKELTTIDPTTWIWKKKGEDSCPYKNYTGGLIPNILLDFRSIKNL